ncbi:MAG TPA: hypothetical protein ENK04_11875 [Gammaproteobacteria bacterium]|nr:hypothetical protein [Gammaproteobacteria bacterium]
MKLAIKPVVLGTSILLLALVAVPLAYSGEQHAKGMAGQHDNPMMDMSDMQGQMGDMSKMMEEAHATKDINKRHELMRKHMAKMKDMMGKMKGMMGDSMPDNMSAEQCQEMMSKRMDMMQGMMEQMLKQQSMIMDTEK